MIRASQWPAPVRLAIGLRGWGHPRRSQEIATRPLPLNLPQLPQGPRCAGHATAAPCEALRDLGLQDESNASNGAGAERESRRPRAVRAVAVDGAARVSHRNRGWCRRSLTWCTGVGEQHSINSPVLCADACPHLPITVWMLMACCNR